MADNEELLPCPFCGLAEHLSLRAEGSYTPDMPARPYRVVCNHIDHDTVEGPIGYGRKGATTAWNRRALPSTTDAAGVTARVKPLEWASEPPYSVARVFLLRLLYSTEAIWDDGAFQYVELSGATASGRFATVAEAKAAAQADYEARISSALLPIDAPAREGGGETKLIDDIINGTAPMSKWMGSVDYSTYDGFEEYLKTQLREKMDLKVRLDKKRHESAEDESLATFVDGGSGALEAALATYRTVRERVAAASPAEPAAHSLQTLAPASDAVKPGDET